MADKSSDDVAAVFSYDGEAVTAEYLIDLPEPDWPVDDSIPEGFVEVGHEVPFSYLREPLWLGGPRGGIGEPITRVLRIILERERCYQRAVADFGVTDWEYEQLRDHLGIDKLGWAVRYSLASICPSVDMERPYGYPGDGLWWSASMRVDTDPNVWFDC